MNPQITSYAFLAAAIIFEVIGSSSMMKSEQFSKLLPSVIAVGAYIATFYFLSHALKTIPLGIAYGIWGALGIVLTAGVGYFMFKQKLDLAALIGIAMMVSGVLVVQIFSKSVSH